MKLGLNERQSKVYLALLNQIHASAVELQQSSGVPQTKIYEILKSLMVGGYCRERKIGRRREYQAVDPDIAFAQSMENLKKLHEEANNHLRKLSKKFKEAEEFTEPSEYIEVVHGNDNIHYFYLKLLQTANKQILGFGKSPYTCYSEEMRLAQDREMEAFIERGGKSRWVYEVNDSSPDWLANDLVEEQNNGVELRVIKNLPVKMMIFDSQKVFVLKENSISNENDLSMTAIKQNATAFAYETLFKFTWDHAERLNGKK